MQLPAHLRPLLTPDSEEYQTLPLRERQVLSAERWLRERGRVVFSICWMANYPLLQEHAARQLARYQHQQHLMSLQLLGLPVEADQVEPGAEVRSPRRSMVEQLQRTAQAEVELPSTLAVDEMIRELERWTAQQQQQQLQQQQLQQQQQPNSNQMETESISSDEEDTEPSLEP
jgi:hypothetical protein